MVLSRRFLLFIFLVLLKYDVVCQDTQEIFETVFVTVFFNEEDGQKFNRSAGFSKISFQLPVHIDNSLLPEIVFEAFKLDEKSEFFVIYEERFISGDDTFASFLVKNEINLLAVNFEKWFTGNSFLLKIKYRDKKDHFVNNLIEKRIHFQVDLDKRGTTIDWYD